MNKKIFVCILSILFLMNFIGISYGVNVNNKLEDNYNKKFDLNLYEQEIAYFFMFGFIYNLSYIDEVFENITVTGYEFNCSLVLTFMKLKGFPVTSIGILRNGAHSSVIECKLNDDADMYYKGFIGERFICCIQVVKVGV